MRERDIEKHLVDRVKQLGGEVRKVQWVGRVGAPDRVVMMPAARLANSLDCAYCAPKGVVAWVELKAPGKKPRITQVREHARMTAMGQRVEVIDSIDGVEKFVSSFSTFFVKGITK